MNEGKRLEVRGGRGCYVPEPLVKSYRLPRMRWRNGVLGNFPYAACTGTRVRKSSLSFDEALSHFPH